MHQSTLKSKKETSAHKEVIVIKVFVVFVFLAILYMAWMMVQRVENAYRSYENRYHSYLLADELRQSSDDLTRLARTYAATGDEQYKTQYDAILAIRDGKKPRPEAYHRIYWDFVAAGKTPRANDKSIALLELMKQAGFTDTEFKLLSEAKANSDGLVALEVEAMNAIIGKFKDENGNYTVQKQPNRAYAQSLLNSPQYHTFKAEIMAPIDRFFVALEQRTHGEISTIRDSVSVLGLGIVALIIVAMICSTSAGALVHFRILVPLQKLRRAMLDLADNQLDVELPTARRNDEIGQMTDALYSFQRAAKDKQKMGLEADKQRKKSADDREQAEENRKEAIVRERELVSQSIGSGLARLAAKDLSFRLSEKLPEAYDQLKIDFNTAMEQIEAAMASVSGSAGSISVGSGKIAEDSKNLSRRTEQHAASLRQTAIAMNEITNMVGETADGVRQTQSAAGEAEKQAGHGGDVVKKAVSAMAAIENSSKQISQIIGMIDEISFQTNLLALNAGVEAARAGDAGQGFSVVASEVRAVSQRSAEAAQQIKNLISESEVQVEMGVKLVAESGEVLEHIVSQIGEVNKIASQIATNAERQAASLQQVNTSIHEMDSVTEKYSGMAEALNVSSLRFSDDSSRLSQMIDQFKLGGNSTEAGKAPSKRPASNEFAA